MNDDYQQQVQEYRELVLKYEQLDEAIDALIERNGGHSENISPEDRETYRQLAQERNALFNQIKAIEAAWSQEDEDTTEDT